MSNVYLISDLHFGHRGITRYRPFDSEEEHREYIIQEWNKVVKKGGDHVYVLGDACFTMETLPDLGRLMGVKYLVRGNHDYLPTNAYLAYFKEVYGIIKKKNCWFSHAPIHPAELRRSYNAHGHVHNATILTGHFTSVDTRIPDERYINVCPEAIGYAPVEFRSVVPTGGLPDELA